MTKKQSEKVQAKRSRVKTFVKAINYNHMMPTRYNLDSMDDLKTVVTSDVLDNATKKASWERGEQDQAAVARGGRALKLPCMQRGEVEDRPKPGKNSTHSCCRSRSGRPPRSPWRRSSRPARTGESVWHMRLLLTSVLTPGPSVGQEARR